MWILESNDPELVFRVLSRSLKTVGRAPRADFVGNAPLVSRLHCRLSMDDDNGLDVEDLGKAQRHLRQRPEGPASAAAGLATP